MQFGSVCAYARNDTQYLISNKLQSTKDQYQGIQHQTVLCPYHAIYKVEFLNVQREYL